MYLFTSRLIKEVRRMKKESKLLIRLRNYFSDFLADPCSSRNAYAKAYGKEDNESIKSETISVDLDMIIWIICFFCIGLKFPVFFVVLVVIFQVFLFFF